MSEGKNETFWNLPEVVGLRLIHFEAQQHECEVTNPKSVQIWVLEISLETNISAFCAKIIDQKYPASLADRWKPERESNICISQTERKTEMHS